VRSGLSRTGIALAIAASALAVSVVAGDAPAKYPGPNGKIAFARFDRAIDGYHVFSADPGGANEALLLPDGAENPIWSPDGSRILVVLERADAPLRAATLNPDGSGLAVFDDTASVDVACSAWSPNGARVLCDGTSEERPDLNGLYSARASDGAGLVRLTDNPVDAADIAGDYSPDGERIVFTRQRRGGGRPEGALFVAKADGTEPQRITPFGLPDHDELPKWSPDGAEILFGSATEKLLAVHPDGSGERRISPRTLGTRSEKKLERRLRKRCRAREVHASCRKKARKRARRRASGIGFDPGWSPNGKRIVFSLRHRPRGPVDIYTARPDGTRLAQVTNTPDFETGADWGPHAAR